MFLDKYTKSSVSQQTDSEVTPFSQRGGAINKHIPPYDKNIGKIFYYSDTYRNFTQHPIVQKQLQIQRVRKSYDDKNKSSKSGKSTKTSKAAIITKLRNSQIKIKRSFTVLNSRIEEIDNEDSELTDLDYDDKEKSHLQFEEK